MKKYLTLLLIVLLLLSLVACGESSGNVPNGTEGRPSQNEDKETQTQEETKNNELENWGVVDDFSVQNEDLNVSTVFFRWPAATGRSAATGMAATQSDGTFVLVDGYSNGISPKGVALEEFFPKYYEQTLNAFSRNYGSNYSDGKLNAKSEGVSTINGYKVCKFTGEHSFKFKNQDYTYQFVAYVTNLKANGAYVYWLVQDETSDQSAGQQMEENALKIIQSLWEE